MQQQTRYKVSKPNGKWEYGYRSLEEASGQAEWIFRNYGVVAAIEAYTRRTRTSKETN